MSAYYGSRAGPGRDLPRHRRHLRPVPRRGAGWPGDPGQARRGRAGHEVRCRPRAAASEATPHVRQACDAAPRARRPPDRGGAERVVAVVTGHRARGRADVPRAERRRGAVLAARPRFPHRALPVWLAALHGDTATDRPRINPDMHFHDPRDTHKSGSSKTASPKSSSTNASATSSTASWASTPRHPTHDRHHGHRTPTPLGASREHNTMTTFVNRSVAKIIRSRIAPHNDQRPADDVRLRAADLE